MNKALTLRDSLDARGLSEDQYRILEKTLYRGAAPEMILLAVDYCKAQELDIFSRPVHIVSVYDAKAKKYVQDIWPGIHLYRIRASRTGQYAGKTEPYYGDNVTEEFGTGNEKLTVTYPKFCQMTVYRDVNGTRCPFPVQVFWKETYAAKGKSGIPNSMWAKRPYGQLAKCAEAEALREAFPESAPGPTAEEMEGQMLDIDEAPPAPPVLEPAIETFPTEPIPETEVEVPVATIDDALGDTVAASDTPPPAERPFPGPDPAEMQSPPPEEPPPPPGDEYEFMDVEGNVFKTEDLGLYVQWITKEIRTGPDSGAVVLEANWGQLNDIPDAEKAYVLSIIPEEVVRKYAK